MRIIKRIILMLQFLTTIPIKYEAEAGNEDFGKGLAFAPLIGLVIGIILAFSFVVLNMLLPQQLCVALILIEYIVLTGGLHLDGLGDTFDGLFSNRPKERILEIMRDSRVGTNAVLAIISVFLLNFAFLSEFYSNYIIKMLILFPVAGRLGSIVGASLSKYARSGEGLGKSFIDYCGKKELAIGTAIYLIIFLVADLNNFLWIFPIISAVVLIKLFSKKIDGATGDVLGAVCELNQTIFIIVSYIILNVVGR